MRVKKVRGMKRKYHKMINNIKENTMEFPTGFFNGYWHLHLPVAQDFISSEKTPKSVKRQCIQALLDRAEHLIGLKPTDKDKYRVVVAIDLPHLWNSQIIIFKGESHFKNFFERNDEYQKWLHLPDNRNIKTEWDLLIPNEKEITGFKEIITDEDHHYEGEIWFIGQIK